MPACATIPEVGEWDQARCVRFGEVGRDTHAVHGRSEQQPLLSERGIA
jgi:hypothetical protein